MYYTYFSKFVKFLGITARTQTVPPYGRNVLNVTQSPRDSQENPGESRADPVKSW